MTEINLLRTSGANPAGPPGKPVICSSGPSTRSRKTADAVASHASGLCINAKIDPGSCVTAELPVFSGAGQIYDADHKPANPAVSEPPALAAAKNNCGNGSHAG